MTSRLIIQQQITLLSILNGAGCFHSRNPQSTQTSNSKTQTHTENISRGLKDTAFDCIFTPYIAFPKAIPSKIRCPRRIDQFNSFEKKNFCCCCCSPNCPSSPIHYLGDIISRSRTVQVIHTLMDNSRLPKFFLEKKYFDCYETLTYYEFYCINHPGKGQSLSNVARKFKML